MKTNPILFLLISTIIIINGCSTTNNIYKQSTPIKNTIEESKTVIPLKTTSPSQVIKNIETPTTTTVPTLPIILVNQTVADLMKNNSNCEDPCFWGLKTGIGNNDNSVQLIKSLAKSVNSLSNSQHSNGIRYYSEFTMKKDLKIYLNFLEKDEKILGINASIFGLYSKEILNDDWLAFRPNQILESYGTPEKIQLSLGSNPVGFFCHFSFIYKDFVIEYIGPEIEPSRKTQLCLLSNNKISAASIWIGSDIDSAPPYREEWDLSKISNLTNQEFYNLLVGDPSNSCFYADFENYLNH